MTDPVTITLPRDAAQWLYDQMGRRPASEDVSRDVWDAVAQALSEERAVSATAVNANRTVGRPGDVW